MSNAAPNFAIGDAMVKVTVESNGMECNFAIPIDGQNKLEWPLDVKDGKPGDILHLHIQADIPRYKFSGWRRL